jgi:hypothetical protein
MGEHLGDTGIAITTDLMLLIYELTTQRSQKPKKNIQ